VIVTLKQQQQGLTRRAALRENLCPGGRPGGKTIPGLDETRSPSGSLRARTLATEGLSMLTTILVIVLILLLIGALPSRRAALCGG
jgi:hypothetical protein